MPTSVFFGNGDVYGPSSATSGSVAVFSGTTGKLIADGGLVPGTVTSVSVTTANGVSGTVATATTTPAITVALGTIAPVGTITSADATTPILATASGKTNTGYLSLTGKTSGSLKILPADALAQVVTVSIAAQTVGSATLTIPDQANVSSDFVFSTLAQTLTNKTLTSPVIASIAADLSVVGTVTSAHATTPILATASGKTNTGYLSLTGKTSGSFKILPADATAQIVTMAIAAQTSGASTLTIPDQAGASSAFVFDTLAQTLTNKTLTAPVIGVATGTSLAVTGLLKSSGTAGIGYATGAGGAQTQQTDKSTTVVSNTITTAITMNGAQLALLAIVAFTFTNSTIAATDTVVCTHESAGTSGAYTVNAFPGAGSAVISVRNNTAGNLSEAIVIRVTVIKSVST